MANKALALGILAMVTKYSQRACLNSSGIKEPKLLERMPTKRRGDYLVEFILVEELSQDGGFE